MDVSKIFKSSVHLGHKTSKPGCHRSVRNITTAASARHFRRESLFSKGTKEPEDVVQRCLTHFRKCDLPSLSQYLVDDITTQATSTPKPPVLLVGNKRIQEQGPLACLHPILDIGARRVLPGHLLRRSRVLGTLRLTPLDFQQRIALTAQTGEESIFTWHLHWLQDVSTTEDDPNIDNNQEKGRWVISKIDRESEQQEKEKVNTSLPSTPQPKSSPEAVIYVQLQALQRGDVYEASQFNTWRENDRVSALDGNSGGDEQQPTMRNSLSLGLQFKLLGDILVNSPYSVLKNHNSAVLGPAALPTQHRMLQEVWVKRNSGSGNSMNTRGDWVRFIWNLELESSNGCWMCTTIEPYLENAT